MSTTSNNVRQRLKTETSEAHERLDGMMTARGPFDSPENYAWYLSGMHALHGLCQASTRWVDSQIGFEPRQPSLAELIESDFATLGSEFVFDETTAEADSRKKLDIASRWGQAYVMEGSAIGASFMIRGAKAKIADDVGCQYLSQLAADAKGRWPKFVAALSAADIDGDLAVLAASNVFEEACRIFAVIETT